MTKHWIRTKYVPKRYEHLITPNKWYELTTLVHDNNEGYCNFTNDQGETLGTYLKASSLIGRYDWEYKQTTEAPENIVNFASSKIRRI